jgi:hypothetical protein
MCGTDKGGIGRVRSENAQKGGAAGEHPRDRHAHEGRWGAAVPGETRAAGCAGRAVAKMDAGRDEQGNAMRKCVWGVSGARGTGVAAKRAAGGATVSTGRRGEAKGRQVRADVMWRGTAATTAAAMAAATSKTVRGDCAVVLGWRCGTNVATVRLPVVALAQSLRRSAREEKGLGQQRNIPLYH